MTEQAEDVKSLPVPVRAIAEAKTMFMDIARNTHAPVVWEKEAMFAKQIISKNDYLFDVAAKHPMSLRDAVINVASVGLSLNPALSHAYLVPRDGAVCLDIGYRGLIQIATDTGSILWAQAEVVHQSDEFKFNGVGSKPDHSYNPFSTDRGQVVGAYCVAKTVDGDYLTDVMSIAELDEIRKASKASNQNAPWQKWPNEMRKKAVIKRASKTWPKSTRGERLDHAIEFINESEGIDFKPQGPSETDLEVWTDWVNSKNGPALLWAVYHDSRKWDRCFNVSAKKGQKGKYGAMINEWRKEATEAIMSARDDFFDQLDDDNAEAARFIYNDLNRFECDMFHHFLSPEQEVAFNNSGVESNHSGAVSDV